MFLPCIPQDNSVFFNNYVEFEFGVTLSLWSKASVRQLQLVAMLEP
jgi:hypothetical protein